jgi:hypothetical protein
MQPINYKKDGFQPRKKTITEAPKQCIICLDPISCIQNYTYSNKNCKCRPQMHDACFNKWKRGNYDKCPSCKNNGTHILQPTSRPRQEDPENSSCVICVGCTVCCMSIFDIF